MGTLEVVVRHMDSPSSFWIGRVAICGSELMFTGLRLLSDVSNFVPQEKSQEFHECCVEGRPGKRR